MSSNSGVSAGLNLLPSQAKFQAQRIFLAKAAKLYMLVFSLLWVVAVVGTYGVSLYVNVRLRNQLKATSTLEAEVKSLNGEARTGWRLKYIAGLVAKALSGRFEYGETFELVNGFFDSEMGVSKIEMRESGLFVVAGKTESNEVIDRLEERVSEANTGKIDWLKQIEITAISFREGAWNYNLQMAIK